MWKILSETWLNKPKGMTEHVVVKNLNRKKKPKFNLWHKRQGFIFSTLWLPAFFRILISNCQNFFHCSLLCLSFDNPVKQHSLYIKRMRNVTYFCFITNGIILEHSHVCKTIRYDVNLRHDNQGLWGRGGRVRALDWRPGGSGFEYRCGNFASELWQFRLSRFASVFRRRH